MVFYLKYRPQTIAELDLARVRSRLYAILKSQDLPHAFLFTGSKGLGKTSTARILAKAINCEVVLKKKKDSAVQSEADLEPCNACKACTSITNGSAIDVLEIDAASNRGIDEIRSLRERVKYAPSTLAKKVYIIDEVHMLTTEAFNALLKTLEEPPTHVVFILCTTEVWKVLPTIVSRAFHISFEKPTEDELARSLERVVRGEHLKVEKSVYEKLYTLSDGAFRDATKILEELAFASSDTKKITAELLESTYRMDSIDTLVKEFMHSLAEKDAKKGLGEIEKLSEEGVDFKIVNEKIVENLRDELFAKTSVVSHAPATDLTVDDIKKLLEIFNEAYKNIRYSVLPQLPLEIAVVTWCTDQIFENQTNAASKANSQADASKAAKQPESTKRTYSKPDAPSEQKTQSSTEQSDFFIRLIDAVKQENHTIAGILRGCTLVHAEGESLVLEAKYKFHGEKLSEDKARKIIEAKASEILARPVSLLVNTIQS